MKAHRRNSRVTGAAFLFQFITSVASGIFMRPAWSVPGDIGATMLRIAGQPAMLRANILVDMLTALGVVVLGALLYITLRRQNEKIALVALGFYILEAGLLATSRMATFALLRLSQAFASAGGPDDLLAFGNLALEAMDFVGDTLHVLAFCLGGILFYYLLDRSRGVPRWISLWGLITIFPVLIGALTAIFGLDLPFVLFLPYFPFEFAIGVWISVKGISETGP